MNKIKIKLIKTKYLWARAIFQQIDIYLAPGQPCLYLQDHVTSLISLQWSMSAESGARLECCQVMVPSKTYLNKNGISQFLSTCVFVCLCVCLLSMCTFVYTYQMPAYLHSFFECDEAVILASRPSLYVYQ